MKCRHCKTELKLQLVNLGSAPPSNSYLTKETLHSVESWFPLRVLVCETCWLAQTEDYNQANELFQKDYAYFSSTSKVWLEHAKKYSEKIIHSLTLDKNSFVIEIASNDGYLLKNFVAKNIPCLGIEPTTSTAEAAKELGIPVLQKFFGEQLAQKLVTQNQQADLIIGNNVYAHVPDINDFTKGLKATLKEHGTITLEFPHVLQLIKHCQFDTIYHEHFSYLSLYTVQRIFKTAGLRVFDVEELQTHGGSLRIYGCHVQDQRPTSPAVDHVLRQETSEGLQSKTTYLTFENRVNVIKDNLLLFLLEQKKTGRTVAAYGAAAKGNTLLNYAGIRPDLLSFICDAAPAKQGKYMPGSRIPIFPPNTIDKLKPDLILILPWNIAHEITAQLNHIRDWGGEFVVAVPEIKVFT